MMIKDQTSEHNTISLEKFVKRVASAVCRFMNVSRSSKSLSLTLTSQPIRRSFKRFKDKIQTGGSVLEGLLKNRFFS